MLKSLQIQHLILIDHVEIQFEDGLNVLSGETGSGKSAIMEALSLVAGTRADTGVIRKGHEKGSVEAVFELSKESPLLPLLQEAGIEFDLEDDLIIRREIYITGKSRAFINNQAAQQLFLRKLGEHLIKFVGQHASQLFQSIENHRLLLDKFAGIGKEAEQFAKQWNELNRIQQELNELKASKAQREREAKICRDELEEIQEAQIKEGEEEELFAEYSRMNDHEEIVSNITQILDSLDGERASLLSQLTRLKLPLEQLAGLQKPFEDSLETYQQALVSLQEVGYFLQNYLSQLESNPQRLQELNERLTLLNKFKKRYGATLQDVLSHQEVLEKRLEILENTDFEIERLENEVVQKSEECEKAANNLSNKRTIAAEKLGLEIVAELRSLNMPKVELEVQLSPQKRSSSGDERIEIFMRPNFGEHLVPIRDCASGGELSRLMLAFETVMAGKEQIPILVFDEVDANIGGETASIVGEKLSEIGKVHQVLCVTHFPQVASHAAHHWQISKHEVEGRTLSMVKRLQEAERQAELTRMLGGG